MKTLLRNLLSRIPGLRFWMARAIFFGPNHNTHRFWGVFPTYAAARAYVPSKFNRGFDSPTLADFEDVIPERDQHVITALTPLMPHAKNLFDLGGNGGTCFYQYRRALTYPPDFRWTVCDVPEINEKGRELAAKRMETQLAFTDKQSDADGADIYLTNGALQYFDVPFAQIIGALKNKPPHLIINRIPLSDKRPFFTLQHMGYSVVPYRIDHRLQFVADLQALGYRLAEHWENDRFCEILLRPELRVEHYYGFHFIKADA